MTPRVTSDREWATRPERGSVSIIQVIVWIARKCGRPLARLLLYPICVYFIAASPVARAASRGYLRRVLQRSPGPRELFHHYHTFAAVLLDRVFLLSDRHTEFDIQVFGDETLCELAARGEGCLLFGAHLGSFEIIRTIGRRLPGLVVSMAMYEENARKISSVLDAINPRLSAGIISLGRSEAMIEVAERLDRGEFVGLLADRMLQGEDSVRMPFLGAPAAFPLGPFRVAASLRRPVVLMMGVYRGGRRYDVFFEPLADFTTVTREQRSEAMLAAVRRFSTRIEQGCRDAPYNWFNFYDFWH